MSTTDAEMAAEPVTRISSATLPALVSGVSGLVANVLLILFFALARPFDDGLSGWSWLGTVNDVILVVQFAALVPVGVMLRRRLPVSTVLTIVTWVGVVAMAAIAVLQAALVVGLVNFDTQVLAVIGCLVIVFSWVLVVSSVAHRRGLMRRSTTRLGLVIGAGFPLALLITAPGLLLPSGSIPQLALVVPGVVLGAAVWLTLPIWTLLLAGAPVHHPTSRHNSRGES